MFVDTIFIISMSRIILLVIIVYLNCDVVSYESFCMYFFTKIAVTVAKENINV